MKNIFMICIVILFLSGCYQENEDDFFKQSRTSTRNISEGPEGVDISSTADVQSSGRGKYNVNVYTEPDGSNVGMVTYESGRVEMDREGQKIGEGQILKK